MNYIDIIKNGIVKENPTFVLMLGMCPTLATTTSAMNGMSMGLATMAVLICTNFVISCLKSITPDKVRIPCVYRGDRCLRDDSAVGYQGFPARY